MNKVFFLAILSMITTYGFSQKLIVKDASTLQSIVDVLIFSNHHSAITNIKGEINLEGFVVGDSLYFQHPSYNSSKLLLSNITNDIEFLLIEKSIKLDEIIVSVSRWAESSTEFPNKVVGITRKDIEFYNPQTTADALAQTGEIYIQKSQLGGGSPMIRGFAANRILLTVDGVRLNNAIFRSGNLQNIISIDPHSLERTEVIFGPGSVQYGSDALGGVVNMMTITSRLSSAEPIISGGGLIRYSSANKERTAHFDISYSGSNFASVTSLSFSNYGDLLMGRNGRNEYLRPEYATTINGIDSVINNDNPERQVFTGFGQFSFIQKLRFKLSSHLTSEVGFYYSNTNNIPRYDRLIQYRNGSLRYANWYYGPQEWVMGRVDFTYSSKNKFMEIAKLLIAYQQVKESRHERNFGSAIRRNRFEEVDIFSINLDFTKPLSEFHHLYYGFNAGFNVVGSMANEINLGSGAMASVATRYPDGSVYNNYAVYLNYEYKPSAKLNLIAGIRYSQFVIHSTFDQTFYPFPFTEVNLNPGAPSGSLGAVINPNQKTSFQVNFSTAFRAPNIDDIGKVFDSEPGNVVVPNPSLQSEYAYNLDIGIMRNFGKAVKVEITGFYTLLDNAMVRRDFLFNGQDSIIYDGELSKVQALVNTGSAYLYGVNAKLFVDFTNQVSLTSTYNLVKGEDDLHLPLRHVTPMFGSTHLLYKQKRIKLDLFADYSGQFENDELAVDEQNKAHLYAIDENGLPFSPRWFTLNFKSTLQLSTNVQFNFGVDNILDTRYKPYSSGLVAPGRNWILGLRGYF